MDYNLLNLAGIFLALVVAIFLAWEIYLFVKESRKRKINLPDFVEGQLERTKISAPEKIKVKEIKFTRQNIILGLVIFALVVGLGVIGIVLLRNNTPPSSAGDQTAVVEQVESEGIKIFDLQWNELTDEQVSKLQPGDQIYIGIDKTPDESITKARIRVNSTTWGPENITENLNEEKNVFYIQYEIKPDDQGLNIQAQLFSEVSGWLVE